MAVAITKAELKALQKISRRRFTDDQVGEALRYQLTNECTLAEAALKFGMTAQTLATRRQKLYVEAGLAEAPASQE